MMDKMNRLFPKHRAIKTKRYFSMISIVFAAAVWPGCTPDVIEVLENPEGLIVGDAIAEEITPKNYTLSSNYTETISIADGSEVTLSGATISSLSGPALLCEGNATIILSGSNTVACIGRNNDCPAIQAGPPGTTLTIRGTGSLTATSLMSSAGIGSGFRGKCGDIVILEGTVNATGGSGGAGIGTGNAAGSTCGTITIEGGTVNATGGSGGAGIGSGSGGSFGGIVISSGITRVVAIKGQNAEDPIGCGYADEGSGKVTIDEALTKTTGTTVKEGDTWAVAKNTVILGTPSQTVTIPAGETVELYSATINVSAGPALLCEGNATIILNGNNVVSTGEACHPAIQAGPDGTTLTIRGDGNLTATGANHAAGIGCGYQGSCGAIIISGGVVTATGGTSAAAIGSGFKGKFSSIDITSEIKCVVAIKGKNAEDPIGCGYVPDEGSGKVTIDPSLTVKTSTTASEGDTWTVAKNTVVMETSSQTVTIPAGETVELYSATINVSAGPAIRCEGDATIILNGSNAVSTSEAYHPAIQAGPDGTTLTIRGDGSLTATGATYAAGIGCGYQGSCGAIVISGGTVNATGGSNAAAIGSGYEGKFSSINITSGISSVMATKSGVYSVPIGKGSSDTGSGSVTIDGSTNWLAGIPTENLFFLRSNNNYTWILTHK